MPSFICIGNVRKGMSIKQAKAMFRLPESVNVIFGQPQNSEQMSSAQISNSVFWGVWVQADQYEVNKGKVTVIKSSLRGYISRFWLYIRSL